MSFKAIASSSLILSLLTAGFSAFAVVPKDPVADPRTIEKDKGFFIEYFNYEDRVYSQSRKTELGDKVEIDGALRYEFSGDSFWRARFETDPSENRYDNKTSKFELLAGHRYEDFYFQVDGELKTDDGTSGGISIGFDVDSELTRATWDLDNHWSTSFYPFNFDGEVGYIFNTWDVTRIYFIEGSPSSFGLNQVADERLGSKTIPGLDVSYGWGPDNARGKVYAGLGVASFLYPANSNFNIETSTLADRWERREDFGFKVGAKFQGEKSRTELKYVTHSDDTRTGSLLKSAASVYTINQVGRFMLEGEVTYSEAGDSPYEVNRAGTWFGQTTAYEPVYSDRFLNRENWIGKKDAAASFKLGFVRERYVPYLSYKYQGKNFIFRDRESAHLLRTADEDQSHGGLSRTGLGAYIYRGSFAINPEFEWMHAQNKVFTNSGDLRRDRQFSEFERDDFALFLTISYQYGTNKLFTP